MNKHYVCILARNDKSIHIDVVPESSEIKITFNTAADNIKHRLVFYEEYQDKTNIDEQKHEINSWIKLIIKKVVDIYSPQREDWSNWIFLN